MEKKNYILILKPGSMKQNQTEELKYSPSFPKLKYWINVLFTTSFQPDSMELAKQKALLESGKKGEG